MIDITDIFDIFDITGLIGGGGSSVPSYSPAFWLNNMGQSNQPGTSTRTSTATVLDHEGILVTGDAGEIILDGGRREQNNTPSGKCRDLSGWNSPSTGDVTLNATVSSDGELKANLLSKNSNDSVLRWLGGDRGEVLAVDAKIQDPSEPNFFYISFGQVAYFDLNTVSVASKTALAAGIEDLGSGWYRCYVLTLGSSSYGIRLTNGNGTTSATDWTEGKGLYIDRVMTQTVTGRENQLPSEFLDSDIDYGYGVNGVKWYDTENGAEQVGAVVTTSTGATITPAPQVLMQPQRPKHLFPCRDLTHANWVKTDITAALDATGIDGVESSASTLTATANNGTVFNSLTLASADYVGSAFVRRKTGTGTIEFTDDGGSTYTDITSEINSTTYARVQIASTQENPSVGFRVGTSGDEIEVDYCELEPGLVATTPVETTTAAATRDADKIEFDNWDSLINTDEGVALYRMKIKTDLADASGIYVRGGDSANRLVTGYAAGSGLAANDGANWSVAVSGGLAGEELQVGVAWSVAYNKFAIGYHDPTTGTFTWGSEKVFAGWTSGGALKLDLGQDIERAYTISKLELYKGQPPESASFSDMKTWVEANR